MANIDKRGKYVPRRQREKRAYQLAKVGSTSGVLGVVTLLLSLVGVGISIALPIILLIVAALCYVGFQRSVSGG